MSGWCEHSSPPSRYHVILSGPHRPVGRKSLIPFPNVSDPGLHGVKDKALPPSLSMTRSAEKPEFSAPEFSALR